MIRSRCGVLVAETYDGFAGYGPPGRTNGSTTWVLHGTYTRTWSENGESCFSG